MTRTRETIKRIIFVFIVFLTFVLFVISCVHDIVADDEESGKDVEVMENESKSDSESSGFFESGGGSDKSEIIDKSEYSDESAMYDESEDSEEPSEMDNSSQQSFDGNLMAGATHGSLGGVYVNSPHCFVYDSTNKVILYEKNAYDKAYPASVTKLLTAAVALEYVPIDTAFYVGKEINMVGYNSSMAYIKEGQSYALKDLLYALLLPSGNDAAHTIAVNTSRYLYGKSLSDNEAVEKFMDLCNSKLLEIGAYNTNFSGPDGYHHDDHYTTAYDMMLISLYAASFEEITDACSTYTYYCKTLEGESMGWLNTNPLLAKHGEYYCPLVNGLKTGSTDIAGKCLCTTAEKDGKKLFIVILGAPNVDMRNRDMLRIIHTFFGNCK